tara:strand:+ start:151 stop:372 length:222 start_codon:yes stop_codon:yes gene_type:complete
MLGSKSFNLSSQDLGKVGKGAVIAGCGAALYYVLQYFQALPEAVAAENPWVPVVVAGLGVLVNLVRKLAVDNT